MQWPRSTLLWCGVAICCGAIVVFMVLFSLTESVPIAPTVLTVDASVTLEEQVLRMTHAYDPSVALVAIEAYTQKGLRGGGQCHNLTHIVGAAALAKYGDLSTVLSYDRSSCTSGYLHGVMEAYVRSLGQLPLDQLENKLASACDLYPHEGRKSRDCFHGVGHGMMLIRHGDLKASLESCSRYTEFGRENCKRGTFMELFFNDGRFADPPYKEQNDPIGLCASQSEDEDKRLCFANAPYQYLQQYPTGYREAVGWCEGAGEFKEFCGRGIGAVTAVTLARPHLIEEVCSADGVVSEGCIEVAAFLLMVAEDDLSGAQTVCGRFSPGNQEFCEKALRDSTSLFERDLVSLDQ